MVLSCSELNEDVSSLLDSELDDQRQNAVSVHISECVDCRLKHDRFKGVGSLLQKLNERAQNQAPDIWEALSGKLPSVCICIQDDLSAYLDGELIASAQEGVAIHLDQCKECLNKFNQLSKVNSLLSKGLVLPDKIEVDIWSQIKTRLDDDCVLIRNELSPFIDKEVVTLRHRTITTHLTECGDCKEHFNELSQTGDLIRANYQPEMAEDFDLWPAIQAKMNVLPLEPNQKLRPMLLGRRMYAAAAVAILGIAASLGVYLYTQTQMNPSVTPITAEAYLIDQSLGEPTDVAEAVVYEHNE